MLQLKILKKIHLWTKCWLRVQILLSSLTCMTLVNYLTSMNHGFLIRKVGVKPT